MNARDDDEMLRGTHTKRTRGMIRRLLLWRSVWVVLMLLVHTRSAL
jgi:hypothetical protein